MGLMPMRDEMRGNPRNRVAAVAAAVEAKRRGIARRLTRVAAAMAAVLSLAACESTGSATGSTGTGTASASASGSSTGFPVTIKHVHGTTTISSRPTRVATVGWASADTVIALGVTPVSIPKNTYGKTVDGGYLPWTKATLDDKGVAKADLPQLHDESDDIDAEAIASTSPDVIIGLQSGITKEQYATLSKIAPTIAYQKVAWFERWRALPPDRRYIMRTYTIRRAEPSRHEVTVDFVIHDHPGPAGSFAMHARPGDEAAIVGPFAASPDSAIGIDFHPGYADRLLLVGDETAVPAVAAILDSLSRDGWGASAKF